MNRSWTILLQIIFGSRDLQIGEARNWANDCPIHFWQILPTRNEIKDLLKVSCDWLEKVVRSHECDQTKHVQTRTVVRSREGDWKRKESLQVQLVSLEKSKARARNGGGASAAGHALEAQRGLPASMAEQVRRAHVFTLFLYLSVCVCGQYE